MFHFFKRKKLKPLLDWPVDMHSHIIPGIDDGASSVEDSLFMLREMREMGIKKWITTPHIFFEYYKNDPQTVEAGYKRLTDYLLSEQEDFDISFAAEYYLDEHLSRDIIDKPMLTFGQQYLLFETNMLSETHALDSFIFQAGLRGFNPVMAHPERYNYLLGNFKRLEELRQKGILFQVNMLSFSGYYSNASKKMAREMLDLNLIDFIGTDCHNRSQIDLIKEASYDPYFRKAISSNLLNYSL